MELYTLDYIPVQASYTYTFDESYNNLLIEFTNYNLSDGVKVSSRNIANMTRVDDAASWIQYFEDYTANYNVTKATKNTVQLPVNGQCLVNDDGCPTTTTWCAAGDAHPDCGPTPYNEDTTVNAGVVAGFVVAVAFALIVTIVGTFRRIQKKKMEEQKKRLRNQFARRIAASVHISNAEEALSMDALMKEFSRIDTDGSGGISREELHNFIMDKKVGSISEADFNALFTVLDIDDSGFVEFIEFCAFLGDCVDELDAAAALSKEQKMERVSKAIIRKSQLGKVDVGGLDLEKE
jgi:Ca2+-binding EF-hand superfamily protein